MRYLFVLLAGCAAQPSYYWYQPGVSAAQKEIDRAQCDEKALSYGVRDQERIILIHLSCMKGKGWQLLER